MFDLTVAFALPLVFLVALLFLALVFFFLFLVPLCFAGVAIVTWDGVAAIFAGLVGS